MQESRACFGRPGQWAKFANDHPDFLEELPCLIRTTSTAFDRNGETEKPVDRVVFFHGMLCWEDFHEILLLASNGFGFGALKIVRGMFERLVTSHYLHLHPEEVDNYLDFHHVAEYKLAREMFEMPGVEMVTAEMLEEKKALRDAVYDKFKRPCPEKGCTREIRGYTWSKLDLISMARECGSGIRELVPICYYVPIQHTHPSVQSILSHISSDGDCFHYAHEMSSEWSGRAVIAAHNLMLRVLELQTNHFPDIRDSVAPLLQQSVKAFHRAWDGPEQQQRPDEGVS